MAQGRGRAPPLRRRARARAGRTGARLRVHAVPQARRGRRAGRGGPVRASSATPSTRAGSSSRRVSRSRCRRGRSSRPALLAVVWALKAQVEERFLVDALSRVRGVLRAHALPARPVRVLIPGVAEARLAGTGRAGVRLPPRVGRGGAHPGVPRGHAHGPGRGGRSRVRARPDRQVARLRLRRASSRRARARATAAATPRRSPAGVEADAARVAKPHEVEEATGFAPGAVAPFPLPEDTVVLMDSALFSHPLVWAGAGSAQHVLGMPPGGARAARQSAPTRRFRRLTYDLPNPKEPEPMQATEKIWMNGELVDWADAKIHVASHGLNYGSGVFEGIRCYDTAKGPAVFRLERPPRPARELGAAAVHGSPVHDRGAPRGDARASSRSTASRRATSARSRSTATASSESRRSGTPSTS